jgi:hypothetical protein
MRMINYESIGQKIGRLVDEKNVAYGDSFHQSHRVLEVLYPNGVGVEQYKDLLFVARVIDKLFRIASNKYAFGESPYKDLAGYGILGAGGDACGESECGEGEYVGSTEDDFVIELVLVCGRCGKSRPFKQNSVCMECGSSEVREEA